MYQNNKNPEDIIILNLSTILESILNNKLSISEAEWLLKAISYNSTIVSHPNKNINEMLNNIYQTIGTKGIRINNDLDNKDKSLIVLKNYTQFLIKDNNL